MVDHYPWPDTRARVLSQIADMLSLTTVSGPPAPPPAQQGRFVRRGMYMVCRECELTSMYCLCGMHSRATPEDDARAAADLERRARECKGGK
jgi:hypothetical protein